MSMNSETKIIGTFVAAVSVVVIAIVLACMWLWPKYNVYRQRMEGEAILAHAQSSREVAVAEAKAKMESAELLAQAEVTRAGGVAKANKIIGESLKGNEGYLRYLWIQNLENSKEHQVIYVPTECGLPILEASRLSIERGAKKTVEQ
jgi:regulator of protease activity HflC (stomatin/prohibitin superfamily)